MVDCRRCPAFEATAPELAGGMRQVVLLRAVNVGGAGKLPMAGLRALLTDLGLRRVETYVQSGNAVFSSDLAPAELEPMIRDGIATRFGFAPETFVLGRATLASAHADHPFQEADPARVHVFFLRRTPDPDEDVLRALAQPGDGWQVGPCRFTLYTPVGIGQSKLASRLDKHLPGPMTARNLRTLGALMQIAGTDD